MIHFISGKPRGGKSLYAVRLVVEELVYGTRTVITNLPLKLPELNEHIQKKYPDKLVNVVGRVIILNDDETGAFYTVRPNGVRIARISKDEWKQGLKPDYSHVSDGGVFYCIDEIHNFFNARAWAETGNDVLFYLSQHAKLGDTVICITQHIGNVDKQFRSVAQDFTYLRNLGKEKMGMFALPNLFVRKTYLQPATPEAEPMETGRFRLDVTGLGSCYDTAQGVGIHGRGADKTERRKGVPWWVFAVGAPLAIWGFFQYGPMAVAKATEPSKNRIAQTSPVASGPEVKPYKPTEYVSPVGPPVGAYVASAVAPAARSTPGPTNVIRLTGGGTFGPGRSFVTLSDGRILKEDRKEIFPHPNGKDLLLLVEPFGVFRIQ